MSLVIAAYLPPEQIAWLAAHPSRPVVLDYARDRPVWDVPAEADVLMTYARGWSQAPRDAAPPGWPTRLRAIQVAAVGVDAFPPWFFCGPPVACGRGVQADAIAEYALTAMLVHEKGFDRPPPQSPGDWIERPAGGLAGRTIGLFGYGAVGQAIATRALAFGAKVVALRRSAAEGIDPRVTIASDPAAVAAVADHLVVALALTPATRHIVNADLFARANPRLHLINVARGAHVDQAALVAALDTGRIAAATLDVTDPEPLPAGHPLWRHPRVRLTPHSCGQSHLTEARIAEKLAIALDRIIANLPPLDRVDPERGY